jgi:hypothetical protein
MSVDLIALPEFLSFRFSYLAQIYRNTCLPLEVHYNFQEFFSQPLTERDIGPSSFCVFFHLGWGGEAEGGLSPFPAAGSIGIAPLVVAAMHLCTLSELECVTFVLFVSARVVYLLVGVYLSMAFYCSIAWGNRAEVSR